MNAGDPFEKQAHPLRVAILISGAGSTLSNLIERINDGRLAGVRVSLVVSSRREVRGVEISRAAGIRTEIIRPRDYPDLAAFSDALTRTVDSADVELAVMAGFLCRWLFPPHWTDRVINIHPALLPRFGGPGMFGQRVHEAVLASGESTSGCTVHLADHQYDTGPIVAQQRVPVVPGDSPDTLGRRVMDAERELYPWVLRQCAENGVGWLRRAAAGFAAGEPPRDAPAC